MLDTKLLFIAFFIINLLNYALARSTTVGDINIKFENGNLYCDKIVCPIAATKYCLITKDQDGRDPSILIRSNACKMDKGQKPITSVTREKMNPKSKMALVIKVENNGDIRLLSSRIDEHGNKFYDNTQIHI